jgi:hypothetical protein
MLEAEKVAAGTVIAVAVFNAYEYLVACLDGLDRWFPDNVPGR